MSRTARPTVVWTERPYSLKEGASVDALYPRTVQVARMVAGGLAEKEIAHLIGRTRNTVTREICRFKVATGARNQREVVLACRQLGLEPV